MDGDVPVAPYTVFIYDTPFDMPVSVVTFLISINVIYVCTGKLLSLF